MSMLQVEPPFPNTSCGCAGAAVAPVMLEDMTMFEVADRVAQGATVGLIFNGGTEGTGPYVVLGKHNYRMRDYGERIARALGNAMIAPIIPFAPNSPTLQMFAGTITVSVDTIMRLNEDVVRSLVQSGFTRIFMLADHLNSVPPLKLLAERLDVELAPTGVRVFFAEDSYTRARARIETDEQAAGRDAGGHGGLWDTAETMAVHPPAVRPGPFTRGQESFKAPDGTPFVGTGFTGDPRGATPEMGRRFADIRVTMAITEIRELLASATA